MSQLRAVRLPLLATPVALALAMGVLAALPSGAAGDTFSAQGTATLPSPVGFGATDLAFTASCPDAGPSQGLDGWVFTLPDGLDGGQAVVTGSDGADVAAYVYDDTCGFLRSESAPVADLSFTLQPTDRYLSVYATDLPEVTFDLAVGPGVITDPTSTPTSTATATATATSTPTPGPVTLRGRHTYSATPNDPLYPEVPAIAGQASLGTGQWGMKKIKAPQAWQEARATGAGVQVAVLDSGLDIGHPDLSCEDKVRIAPGATPSGVLPVDEDGHGTHVAGVIGACSDNNEGVVGVAPDATLLPFRVLGPDGGTAADLGKAIRAATDAGAHVMNMSLGFSAQGVPGTGSALAYFGGFADDIDPAIAYAVSKGVVIVAAAGNETFPLCGYPALADDVVCVGSTDRRDVPAYYSNFALKADGGVPTQGAALVAPGGSGQLFCDLSSENILSTFSRALDKCAEGAPVGYEGIDGTSMASPHVAGAAALLYDRLGAVRSPANAATIKQALGDSAVDLGAPGFDPQFGSGRLDVLSAVRAVSPVTVDPTPTSTTTQAPIKTTTLTLDAPAGGQRTDALPVSVTLKDQDGTPVAGAAVELTLAAGDLRRVATVTTGPDGTATAAPRLDFDPGTVELSAAYAGSATTRPSGAHQPVQVAREDTALSVVVATGKGSDETVTATLTDADTSSTGVVGATLVLVDDKGGQTTAATNADGQATWAPRGSTRSKTYEVRFAGDSRWLGSTATS